MEKRKETRYDPTTLKENERRISIVCGRKRKCNGSKKTILIVSIGLEF